MLTLMVTVLICVNMQICVALSLISVKFITKEVYWKIKEGNNMNTNIHN